MITLNTQINTQINNLKDALSSVVGVAKVIAFTALEYSGRLNQFSNFVSRGAFNRDTLAQSVMQFALKLGTQYAVSNQLLGERSARLIPLAREALIDNDIARMKAAVKDLTELGLSAYMDPNSGNDFARWGKAKLTELASQASSEISTAILGANASEKLLHTFVKVHSWTPLDNYLKTILPAGRIGDFLARKIHALIDSAIVKNPAYNVDENAQYTLMAGTLKEFLSPEPNYVEPLFLYLTGAPVSCVSPLLERTSELRTAGASFVSAGSQTISMLSSIVISASANAAQAASEIQKSVSDTAATQIDVTQKRLSGPPESQDANIAFGKENNQQQTAGTPQLSPTTRLQDFANEVVRNAVLEKISGETSSPSKPEQAIAQAENTNQIDGTKSAQLREVMGSLSAAQIQPLGERGEIGVAHNWSGRLDRVEAFSHALTPLSDAQKAWAEKALSAVPTKTQLVGNYSLASDYAAQVGALNLRLPEDQYSTRDSAIVGVGAAARSALDYGWGLGAWALGYGASQTSGPSLAQSSELRQLFNTCGGNEDALNICSRYLSPELAKQVLLEPTLEKIQLQNNGTGFFSAGTTQLELLNPEKPSYQFKVQRVGQVITVGMDATWNIARFGADASSMRKPVGQGNSRMVASAAISITLDASGGPAKISHTLLDVAATVENIISFDVQTGAKL